MHAVIDPKTGECVAAIVTDEAGSDPKQMESLIQSSPQSVRRVYADGAYDTLACRQCLHAREIEDIIPPRRGGKVRQEEALGNRNASLRELAGLGCDYELWKKLKRYGRRSLAETFFSRMKGMLGERLASRKKSHQELESLLKIAALNKMVKMV